MLKYKAILGVMGAVLVFFSSSAGWSKAIPLKPSAQRESFQGWRIAISSYTFKEFTFFEAIEKTASLGVTFIVAYPGQSLSLAKPDVKFGHHLSGQLRREVKQKLLNAGVMLVNYGPVELTSSEMQCRKVFDFAKDMGIETIISEPKVDDLDMIESLCKEYRVKLALYNSPDPSLYFEPRKVTSVCRGRSEGVGACADTGNWAKSGVDPAKLLRFLKGRLVTVHMQDFNDWVGTDIHDVPWGTGQCCIDMLLGEIKNQRFNGVITLEYEYNWKDSLPDIEKSLDYYEKVAAGCRAPSWQWLFNGRNLAGWEGDTRFWSVKNGAIHGETTKENPAPNNTFLICRLVTLKDFELRLKYRIRNGNSGIQYRSRELDKWRMAGYQAEVENDPAKRPRGNSAGFLYDEKARGELAMIGEFVVIDEKGSKKVVGNVNSRQELLDAKYHNDGDWNDYVIIARGNHIVHYLNGYKTAEVIDNDPDRVREGLLALQIHMGNPMAVDFKDIRIKHLTEKFGDTKCLFNGTDLTGWKAGAGTWAAEPEGVLQAKSGKNIWTEEAFEDFILDLEFKVAKGTNSGVFLRNEDNKTWKHHGMEIQIQDSYGKEAGKHSCGALYDCLAPVRNMVYPPDAWNHLRITAKKNLLDVVMNGERILTADLDLWTEPHLNPDGTKNKFPVAFQDIHRRLGYIGFQGRHNDNQPIWYRNIKITPLGD